jgi:uncharacterized membrane protein
MADPILAALAAFAGGMIVFTLITMLALYIYTSVVLMVIAQKTKTKNAWLAWIPIANLYLMTQVAKVPWWTFFAFLLPMIPIIGSLGFMAVMVWWWWMIAERRGFPNWYGILMLVPVVNLVFMGIIAWGKK